MAREQLRAAAKKLATQTGLSIGSAYGFPNKIEGNPEEFLIVWSDKEVKFPETFEGFRVVRREVPRPH
jgi:hypothetical protein